MDWRAKLTSRKFWTAVANFVMMMIVAFKGTEETATQISALIMAGAGVIAYIIGEGMADAAHAGEMEFYIDSEEDKSDVGKVSE